MQNNSNVKPFFQLYSSAAWSNNDEIRINIQNLKSYTLPSESYIYIEEKINSNKPNNVVQGVGKYTFTNNGLVFLFSKRKYELNEIEIQKLKNPGISSSLKGMCSHNSNDLHTLQSSGWTYSFKNDNSFVENERFSSCIVLKHLFGFFED